MSRARRRALIFFCALIRLRDAVAFRLTPLGLDARNAARFRAAILGHPVAYCVILPSNYDTDKTVSYPVLYFLHGLGGNEQLLLNSGGMDLIRGSARAKEDRRVFGGDAQRRADVLHQFARR